MTASSRLLAFAAARVAFGAFALITSFYCILAYIPFTFIQFLQFPHLPEWLARFAEVHSGLHLLAFGLLVWSLRDALKSPATILLASSTVVFQGILAAVLLYRPLLRNVTNDASSLIWAIVWLVPLVLIAIVDVIGDAGKVRWARRAPGALTGTLLRSCVAAAVYVTALYCGIAYARHGVEIFETIGPALPFVAGWSIATHLVVFTAVVTTMLLIDGLSGWFGNAERANFALLHLLVAGLLASVLRGLVFPSISFDGWTAGFVAASMGLSITAFLAGLKLRCAAGAGIAEVGALDLTLAPCARGALVGWVPRLVALGGIAAIAYVVSVRAALLDWNFLVQKLGVLAVWAASFAAFHAAGAAPSASGRDDRRLARRSASAHIVPWTIFASVVLLGFVSLKWVRAGELASLDGDAALQHYAAYDVSLRLIDDILAPAVDEEDTDFYDTLLASTNISRAVQIEPVDIELTPRLAPPDGSEPHVFLFVVDSLRQDYVSAYNDGVGFTPRIGEFAAGSIVFRNAFTHYGATGLSQPSIWVGGMLVHQQYPEPFHPMNTLQALLEARSYEPYISIDTIMRAILAPSDKIVALDTNTPDQARDLCATLAELEDKLTAREAQDAPIFAFTQPQNIHISVLNREGNSVVEDGDYDGFHPPYASRVQRIDRCFGGFIDFLERSGLYDDSVVILTSDHGDSLGEEGRWGHGYTIYPEVIRIPLIVHLPEAVRERHSWDPEVVAFSTDITPSLYYLLGQQLEPPSPIFGRSLFAASPDELAESSALAAAASYLVASSYGPVYGILEDNGRRLYIADAIDYEAELFDLTVYPQGRRVRLDAAAATDYERLVRGHVDVINGFYGFTPPNR